MATKFSKENVVKTIEGRIRAADFLLSEACISDSTKLSIEAKRRAYERILEDVNEMV